MEREGVPDDYLGEQEDEEAAAVVVALERPNRPNAHGQLFLDAGRVLMMWGWGALAAVSDAGNNNRLEPDASSAVHALLGLVLWLLGVSLVAVVHVERRFPRAALVGAAVASAVIDCFFVPTWN